MQFDRKNYSPKLLKDIYEGILRPRMIEEKMLILLRQGKISKWFSGIGQEAISVGATHALRADEYILPMHRNLGVFTSRKVPYARLFAQFQGKRSGFTKGRDRSFHFGTNEHHLVGMISHLGPQLGVADGIALANKLGKEKKATLVFTGDGGASEGDFHEALNVAAVWDLPVIFVVENNGYGLSTPSSEQFRFKNFVDKCPGYGIDGVIVDGNNVLDVYATIKEVAQDIRRKPRPIMVEALTFRMRGHEEASGTKYVPKELMEYWASKDPMENYEKFLLKEKVITQGWIDRKRQAIQKDIEGGLEKAYAEPAAKPAVKDVDDVYWPFEQKVSPPKGKASDKRFV
ncbi:MAG: thiamine pyrophosphate-dependent dehydrogenase E1 component subunit alpha, partial [Bacteroidota bacterium]